LRVRGIPAPSREQIILVQKIDFIFLEGQSLFSEAMNQASPEFPSIDRGVRLTSVALFVQVFFGAQNQWWCGSRDLRFRAVSQ
jgi:hypothetical protein